MSYVLDRKSGLSWVSARNGGTHLSQHLRDQSNARLGGTHLSQYFGRRINETEANKTWQKGKGVRWVGGRCNLFLGHGQQCVSKHRIALLQEGTLKSPDLL